MTVEPRYSLSLRLLHWLIAVVVLCLLAVGLTLGTLGYDGAVAALGEQTTGDLYKYHKTFGVLLLVLMLIRLALRVIQGTPPYGQPLPAASRFIGAVVHLALYGVLVAMPVVGWLATAASGYPVQFFDWTLPGLIAKDPALGEQLMELHGLLGWVLIALIVVHVAAGMKHWLVLKDGVMKRMSLF